MKKSTEKSDNGQMNIEEKKILIAQLRAMKMSEKEVGQILKVS